MSGFSAFLLMCNHLIIIIFPQSQLSIFRTNDCGWRHRPLQTPAYGVLGVSWGCSVHSEVTMRSLPWVSLSLQSVGCPLGQAALVVLSVWWYQNHLGGLLKCRFLGSNPDLKIRILGGSAPGICILNNLIRDVKRRGCLGPYFEKHHFWL